MPPKKKSNNGYMSLVMDLAKRMSRADAEKEAAKMWPLMSPAQREPFSRKGGQSNAPKLNCLHESISAVQSHEHNTQLQYQAMYDDIKTHIASITSDATVYHEYFQIMHINTHFTTSDDVCYPAEIGLVRFNLNDGVSDENVYHTIVKPGKFPLGYMGVAKTKSDTFHKISYMDVTPTNMDSVIHSVYMFLNETAQLNGQGKVLPPIYVKEDFRKEVVAALTQMADKYGFDTAQLRIYNLSLLLFNLRNDIRNKAAWPTITQSNNELNNDVYDYTRDIACQFHAVAEAPLHCSRSHVIRMAYILCDNCCPDLEIQLIPGRHIPLDARVENNTSSIDDEDYMVPASSYAESTTCSTRNEFDDDASVSDAYDANWIEVRSHRNLRFHSPPPSVCSSTSTLRDPFESWENSGIRREFRGRGRGTRPF